MADTNNIVLTTIVGIISGVSGFFANTIFRKKELDQKGFELLSSTFQVQFERMDQRILSLENEVRVNKTLLDQAEAKIRDLREENHKLHMIIHELEKKLAKYEKP